MTIVIQSGASGGGGTTTSQGLYVDDIVYRLVRDCGDYPPDSVLIWRWLRDRYRRVWRACDWSFAHKECQLITDAEISSDSVTVTNGSTTVTETTSDAKWTSSVIGMRFRKTGDSTRYTIANWTNSNPDTLTLDRAYEGTSGTVQGYKIFQDTYALATDTGEVGNIVDTTTSRGLLQTSLQELDVWIPSRPGSGNPTYWALAGLDANNVNQIQLYPCPKESRGYLIRYTQEGPLLVGGASQLIPPIFESLLVAGWKADYWGWRANLEDPLPSGVEQAWYGSYEMQFAKELQEMVSHEFRSSVPVRVKLADRYTGHRYLRASKFASRHSSWELP